MSLVNLSRPKAISALLAGVIAASALVGLAAGRDEASAQEAPAGTIASPDSPTEVELRHANLGELGLESIGYRSAVEDYERALDTIDAGRARLDEIDRQLADLRSAQRQLSEGIPALETRIDDARDSVERARSEMADLMVMRYVLEGSESDLSVLDGVNSGSADDERRNLVIETVAAARRHELTRSKTILGDAENAVRVANDSTLSVAERIAQLEAEQSATQTLVVATEGGLDAMIELIRDERQKSRLSGTDLTVVALDAYTTAAALVSAEQPECALDWTLLAGIGRVESRHGTYRGAVLLPDGTTSKPIIGIALDGSSGTAVIGDTDGGVLDGDTTWDRAVGPMQFIPSTWAGFAADANNDGRSDPQNIYDAALAAARYLCRRGPLDVEANVVSAILTYNNSQVYVRAVRANADTYTELGITLKRP